ncbi:MAG TPA: M28 family peptidase, partial [Acidobacteriaceae bacterium]
MPGSQQSFDATVALQALYDLRNLTSDEHGAQRVAWTETWRKARAWFAELVGDLPIESHRDAAGNCWFTLAGESEQALLLGGHLDSVPNGGWLDGALGVLGGYAVLRHFASAGKKPPVTIR